MTTVFGPRRRPSLLCLRPRLRPQDGIYNSMGATVIFTDGIKTNKLNKSYKNMCAKYLLRRHQEGDSFVYARDRNNKKHRVYKNMTRLPNASGILASITFPGKIHFNKVIKLTCDVYALEESLVWLRERCIIINKTIIITISWMRVNTVLVNPHITMLPP